MKEGNVLFHDALDTFLFTVMWHWTYGKGKEGNVLFNNALNTFLFTVMWHWTYGKGKEGNVLFNDALNTFLFTVIWHWTRKEMCYLMMHSTHFIYSYVALDIW